MKTEDEEIDVGPFTKWCRSDVDCLILLYEEHIQDFENQQKSKVWQEIGTKISAMQGKTITGEQCVGKWKGLKSKYKKIKHHNSARPRYKKSWEYYDNLDKIFSLMPEMNQSDANPPTMCSSDDSEYIIKREINYYDEVPAEFVHVGENIQSQDDTTINALKRKAEIEESKGIRHREKMQRMDRFLDLMERLVDHVTSSRYAENGNLSS